MLKIGVIFFIILLTSCSSTQIADSWSNDSFSEFEPKQVLILGATPNTIAKKIYESELSSAFIKRGIKAYEASNILEPSFTTLEQAETTINKEVSNLSKLGFDSVLIATVKGYEEKTPYKGNLFDNNTTFNDFENYYFLNQHVYFDTDYYDNYKVFHIETSLFYIGTDNNKDLVWIASYNLINPQKIKNAIKGCNKAILKSLETAHIIPTL